MALDLILLISNLFKKAAPAAFLCLFYACSSAPQKSSDEESIRLSMELDSLSKKMQKINYGPSLKEGGAFIDKTAEYGLSGLHAVSFNSADLNGDGSSDLIILPSYYSRPKFFYWDARAVKFELWKYDPLPIDFKASFISFVDLNKDRIPDIIAGVLNQKSEVSQIPLKIYFGKMKNGKVYFEEAPNALKLEPEPTSSVSVIDYDLDGWPDLFISNWFDNKNGEYTPVADRLMRNNKGVFEDVSHLLRGERDKEPNQLYPPNAKPTYGSSTCDIDQNGFPDILTVSSSGNKNKLWMNLKDSRTSENYFEDIGSISNYGSDPDGSLIPTGGGRSFFSACADYNDDGIMDVFVGELSHAYDNDSVDKSSILTGSRETYPPYFLRTEYLSDANSESWNQGDRRGTWMDYNLDGRVDLMVDNSGFPPYSRFVLFEQDEARSFINVSSQFGLDIVNPAGSIYLDPKKSGRLSILTAQNNVRKAEIKPRLYYFENNVNTTGRKAIRIHLNGVKSNSDALGAMVTLFTKNKDKKIVQRRWVEYSQGGLPSQNESGVHFGVGEDVEVLGFKVKWPYLKKTGATRGDGIEKLYSIKHLMNQDFIEVTACEDGKVLKGKMSCQF